MTRFSAVCVGSLLLLASTLVASSAAGNSGSTTSPTTPTWTSYWKGRAFPIAPAADDCKVCFYQKANFAGEKYCVGKRDATCTEVAPIDVPSTIGSIRFFASADDCELVANVRVTDPPYGHHTDRVTVDVASTGYQDVVEQLYVEPAGRACFLAEIDSKHYGQCYTSSVSAVETMYSQQFSSVLLFQGADTKSSDFYVVAYEHKNFNNQSAGLSKKFLTSSEDLTVAKGGSLDHKIQSIEYVKCAEA